MSKIEGLAVKNVKMFQGMEGYGFNATVYWKGKKVGDAIDDASGGPVMPRFTNREAEKEIMAKVKELPKVRSAELDFEYEQTIDIVLWDLVEEYDLNRRFKRHCKTKIVFQCEGDDEDDWRTIKGTWNKANKAVLEKRYADKGTPIREFFNQRFGEAA